MSAGKMPLLIDLPAGNVEPDLFRHDVYARMLGDIFSSNQSGVCVGLLGKWGHGKSTIVELLKKHAITDTKIVVFNAWKARGDSVRRQMLIKIMEDLCPADEVKEFKKFADIYVVPHLIQNTIDRKTAEKQARATICHDLFRYPPLAIPLLAMIIFVASIVLYVRIAFQGDPPDVEKWMSLGTALFLPAFTAVVGYIFGKARERFSVLVGNIGQISESQKVRYPEQFKDIFVEKVKGFLNSGKKHRLVIVIDDLDRCDPGTVIEALAAIRQFSDPQAISHPDSGNNRACQFLVPCDERQVILALESDGYRIGEDVAGAGHHDYQKDELLRKFFDIIVRMDPLLPSDLTEYASALSEQIGLDAGEARELIDLAAASNPRKVKQLLNAYKIASERVRRYQTEQMLPPDESMPKKTRTLMTLVALRETTPSVYDWIAEDPLGVGEFPNIDVASSGISKDIISTANRILKLAGDVSPITAEYLMSGRYEKALHGCSNAGAFALALKTGDDKAFAESLKKATTEERDRFRTWMIDRVRRCRTVSHLTSYLSLFVNYSSSGESEATYIKPCVEGCAIHHSLIKGALAGFRYYDALSRLMPSLDDNPRQAILEGILQNHMGNPASSNEELKTLLFSFRLLTIDQQKRFEEWIHNTVTTTGDVKQQEFIAKIVSVLPSDRKCCWGLSPRTGAYLASKPWIDDKSGEKSPANWPKPRMIPVFIGDDAEFAKQAMSGLFAQNGPLANPVSIAESSVGLKPAFLTVSEIIKSLTPVSVPKFFNYFKNWLEKQAEPNGLRAVLESLQPRIFEIGDENITPLGSILANRQFNHPGELWICESIQSQPKVTTHGQSWKRFCTSFFQQYSAKIKQMPALTNQHPAILRRIAEMKWPVEELADELLAFKVQQLSSGTQNPEVWADSIHHLMGNATSRTHAAIMGEISGRKPTVPQAIIVGMKSLWHDAIDEASSTTIANWCKESEKYISNLRDSLDKLIQLKGGDRIVEVLINLLNEDHQWLIQHSKLLDFIGANMGMVNKESQTAFQRKIKQILLSDKEETTKFACGLLRNLVALEPDIRSEVTKIPEKFPTGPMKEIVNQILVKFN